MKRMSYFFHILDYSILVSFVSPRFLCDDFQQHTMDDGKKKFDVYEVEQDDDDAIDNASDEDVSVDDNLDEVLNLEDHDEEWEEKDDVDVGDDNKDDAFHVAKLDDVP